MREKQNQLESSNIVSNPEALSQFFYEFVQRDKGNQLMTDDLGIPKIIVQYWDDLLHMPQDVKRCMSSWEPLESNGYKVMRFDYEGAVDFIRDRFTVEYLEAFEGCPDPAMRGEFFRLCFIYIYGGIVVDVNDVLINSEFDALLLGDSLKIQVLCYSVSKGSMMAITDDLLEVDSSDHPVYYVNHSPILAPANHPLIGLLLEEAIETIKLSRLSSDGQSIGSPGGMSKALVSYMVDSKSTYLSDSVSLISGWSKYCKSTKNNSDDDQWLKQFTMMALD